MSDTAIKSAKGTYSEALKLAWPAILESFIMAGIGLCIAAALAVIYFFGARLLMGLFFAEPAIVRTLGSFVFGYMLGFGIVGIWVGVLADQLSRFLFGYLRFRKGNWVKIKI